MAHTWACLGSHTIEQRRAAELHRAGHRQHRGTETTKGAATQVEAAPNRQNTQPGVAERQDGPRQT